MKKNSILAKCTIIFFILLFILSNSSSVFAISSTDNIGSLKIVLDDIEKPDDSIAINVHIYYIKKAVDIDENTIGFEFTDDFKYLSYIDQRWNENTEAYIEELQKFIKNNEIEGIDFTLDYPGESGFMDMSLGKYLVVVDKYYVNGVEYQCNPLIVDVPTEQAKGDYNFSITANIKSSKVVRENTPSYNPDVVTQLKRLPDTGLPLLSIIILSVSGLILIVIGCILDKNKKKGKE